MFETYWLGELKIIKIKSKSDTHEYICVRKEEYDTVYVPSLADAIPLSEIQIIRGLKAEDLLDVPGFRGRVRFDIGDYGEAEAYFREKLHTWEIRRIERHHNKVKDKVKVDRNFIRRR